MNFDLSLTEDILERTPSVLRHLLGGLSSDWTATSGDAAAWQPYDVIGHLVHGERTDWIPRARIILDQARGSVFEPFDRLAQFDGSAGKTLNELLGEFENLRAENLGTLRSWRLTETQLELRGTHPELGEVRLRQLLATWAVHDLNHLRQIVMSMAKKYESEVGPWREYLGILK